METIYSEKDCIVCWDDMNQWIYVDWRNIPSEATVKKGCEEMLLLLKQKHADRVLNDNSNVTGAWSAAATWVAEDWFPRMVTAGLKKFAWIQSPQSVMSRSAAKVSENENKKDEVIQLFDELASGKHWLASKELVSE